MNAQPLSKPESIRALEALRDVTRARLGRAYDAGRASTKMVTIADVLEAIASLQNGPAVASDRRGTEAEASQQALEGPSSPCDVREGAGSTPACDLPAINTARKLLASGRCQWCGFYHIVNERQCCETARTMSTLLAEVERLRVGWERRDREWNDVARERNVFEQDALREKRIGDLMRSERDEARAQVERYRKALDAISQDELQDAWMATKTATSDGWEDDYWRVVNLARTALAAEPEAKP